MNKKKIIMIVLFVFFITVFICCGIYLGKYYLDSYQQETRYEELANMILETTTNESTPEEEEIVYVENPDNPEETIAVPKNEVPRNTVILERYKDLYNTNNDMVGWIKIEGTHINYPVVQSAMGNESYYLYRNFDKKENIRGCIFAKEACDIFEPSTNITLFGHNMQDGSMFASVGNYRDRKYWEEHDTIVFDTIYEHHVYKIFAAFRTSAFDNQGFEYQNFIDGDESEFNAFIDTCKSLSYYDTGITPTYGDKLICLSTCEYSIQNGRICVAAVMVE